MRIIWRGRKRMLQPKKVIREKEWEKMKWKKDEKWDT